MDRRTVQGPSRGFTLIELMVTVAVAALLGLLVVPKMVDMVDSSKTSVLVNQFAQDVAWARNQAATAQATVQIRVSTTSCDWQTSVNGQAVSEHSMSNASTRYPGIQCSLTNGPGTGLLNFTTQGFITDGAGGAPVSPTLVVTAARGQSWTLQVLASGSVVLNSNTAS